MTGVAELDTQSLTIDANLDASGKGTYPIVLTNEITVLVQPSYVRVVEFPGTVRTARDPKCGQSILSAISDFSTT